jgi:hypothetical protein
MSVAGPLTAQPPAKISQADLYSDPALTQIAPRNRAYLPQYPLWSDGAAKRRWIALPPGTKIITGNDAGTPSLEGDPNHWTFPVGTRLWKEFSFPEGSGGWRRVETRLMEKTSATRWEFASYLWRADGSDADLVPEDGKKDVYPTAPGVTHDIPARSQCLECHSRGGDRVLGFEALQLSSDRDPMSEKPAPGMLNLRTLQEEGLLSHPYAKQPRIVAGSPTARAALGYLHGNCGSCHNPRGSANNTTIRFHYPIETGDESQAPALKTSLNEDADSPPGWIRLVPGHPEKSAVLHRMQQLDPALRMPRIGSKRLDEQGIRLIERWIRGIQG